MLLKDATHGQVCVWFTSSSLHRFSLETLLDLGTYLNNKWSANLPCVYTVMKLQSVDHLWYIDVKLFYTFDGILILSLLICEAQHFSHF